MANTLAFMQAHPLLTALLGAVTALAIVGLWYVIVHHLQAIVVTLICIAGTAGGAVVFWRGVGADLVDLIVIGVYLMVVFPFFLTQAIRRQKKLVPIPATQVPGVVRPIPGTAPKRPA